MVYSKPVRAVSVKQSLSAEVEDIANSLAEHLPEGIVLTLETDRNTSDIPIDTGRIEQVLINLVRNALEAMGSKGIIRISTKPCEGSALLTIKDDGPGVPPEHRNRVFQPFYTTKKSGNGLGLAICLQIISDHGGSIRLEPTSDKGAAFTVFLPGS